MSKASIRMIAESLNLSPGTVSIVLNGRGDALRIAGKTQERIWAEAKKLGYQPNIHARRLRQKATDNDTAIIGVLWPSLYSSDLLVRFFGGIQEAILEDSADVEVVYRPYHYGEVDTIGEVFRNNLFNGVIVVGASDTDVEFIQAQNCNMPVVFFNRRNERHSAVCMDDYNTGAKVAELFHARGHRNVCFVEAELEMRHLAMRKLGFQDACQRLGLKAVPANPICVASSEEGGRDAALRLLAGNVRPSAVFFVHGSMAAGALTVFERQGIRIPQDIEVLGYGDTPLNRLLRPSLSVIDLPVERIVKKCIELIQETINGRIPQPVTLCEETSLILRESCGGFPEEKEELRGGSSVMGEKRIRKTAKTLVTEDGKNGITS